MAGHLDTVKMRERRESLGLSQEEAAKRAGMTAGKSQWNSLESGRRSDDVKISTLFAIARALECTPADLLLPPD